MAAGTQNRVIRITPMHINGEALEFPTIITQFADTWTPQWQQEYVYGRMDPISQYRGTSREVNLNFRVLADNQQQAEENMEKLQKLIQYQYPSYENRPGGIEIIKAPPYFKLRILNIARLEGEQLQGYFKNAITINPGFQAKDKALYYNENFSSLLFSDVEISLTMVVLHQKSVGWGGSKFKIKNYPYNVPGNSSGQISSPRTNVAGGDNTDSKSAPGQALPLSETSENAQLAAKIESVCSPATDLASPLVLKETTGNKYNIISREGINKT